MVPVALCNMTVPPEAYGWDQTWSVILVLREVEFIIRMFYTESWPSNEEIILYTECHFHVRPTFDFLTALNIKIEFHLIERLLNWVGHTARWSSMKIPLSYVWWAQGFILIAFTWVLKLLVWVSTSWLIIRQDEMKNCNSFTYC